jgi:hypothetical protein
MDALLGGARQDSANTDPHELSLREDEARDDRALRVGLLIFSAAFCALVFWAGWKEAAAYERCGLKGALTAGRSCPAATTPAQ